MLNVTDSGFFFLVEASGLYFKRINHSHQLNLRVMCAYSNRVSEVKEQNSVPDLH